MTDSAKIAAAPDEDDDYMNMSFADTTSYKHETSLQRRQRQKREVEARGRVKSKQELAAEQEAAREAALETEIDSSNKGFQMLAKLGYKPGGALGPAKNKGVNEPIRLVLKEDKGGIGLDSDRKRKMKEVVESGAKKVKEDEGDYVERVRNEHAERRREGQVFAAQKITEKFDTQVDEVEETPVHRPLKSANVLWRGVARERILVEQDRRRRYDLLQSTTRLPKFEDDDSDRDEGEAPENENLSFVEEDDLDDDDPEADEFTALPSSEKLEKLVKYLRTNYRYCFWCKYQYPDAELEGCPGVTEDEHD